MKPIKNHYYCVACHRPKMLFETQAKADNFIRYNAAEILQTGHRAPVRSYYCSLCGGWHVTSNPSTEAGERLDQCDNELVKRFEARKPVRPATPPSLYRTTILKLITRIETLRDVYAAGHYTECAELLGGSYLLLNDFGTDDENIRLLRSHLDQWQTRLATPLRA